MKDNMYRSCSILQFLRFSLLYFIVFYDHQILFYNDIFLTVMYLYIFRLNKTFGHLVLSCPLYEIDEVESEMFTVAIVVLHDCTRQKLMMASNEVHAFIRIYFVSHSNHHIQSTGFLFFLIKTRCIQFLEKWTCCSIV
jgi:hypothetical protein